jgi:hypothetical protein
MSANFVVSIVGEYAGSGTGSGGFVSMDKNGLLNIDSFDSTGLFYFKNLIFRIIRKLRILVVYNFEGVQAVISLPNVEDAHNILVDDGGIYCVSTGNNKIFHYDHFGNQQQEISFPGSGDAWHINCLLKLENELYCTAFGVFNNHREWSSVDSSKSGIIYNINKREILKDNLHGPHNPYFLDQKWIVCNSIAREIVIYEKTETLRVNCGGFTRGLTHDNDFIYVGVSGDRKNAGNGYSKIVIIDRTKYEIVDQVIVPFSEIYDIILISDEQAKSIRKNVKKFSLEKLEWQLNIGKNGINGRRWAKIKQLLKRRLIGS